MTTAQNMKNGIVIRIASDHAEIETIKEGVHSVKATTLADIQSVLTRDNNLETPMLPGHWGTLKYIAMGTQEMYLYVTAPHTREVIYDFRGRDSGYSDSNGEAVEGSRTQRKYKIAVPALLWIFHTNKDRDGRLQLRHTMVYSLMNWVMGEGDRVYNYPFSNVSDYCCWGDIRPNLGTAKSITSLPEQFLNGIYNSDLDNSRFSAFQYEKDGRQIPVQSTVQFFEYMNHKTKEAEAEGNAYAFELDKLRNTDQRISDVISRERRRFG